MTQNNPQVPWTDEQWNRVTQVIQEEACRARVAATFLPLYGPLPPDTDFVRNEGIQYPRYPDGAPPPTQRMAIDDTITIQLATLQVKVIVRGAQLADPEMTSVLALFRRAANVLARLEDVVVFRGLKGPAGSLTPIGGADPLPAIWEITAGDPTRGLWERPPEVPTTRMPEQWIRVGVGGEPLVIAVSDAIGRLEDRGHFGPFAVVFGQQLFLLAQTPEPASLVLPQDRIIPFLGGGPLLRSSALTDYLGRSGVIVALGGAPVELVVATDVSLQFLQVTTLPSFVFRVYEKIRLRIKHPDAIINVYVPNFDTGDLRGGGRT